MLPDQEQIAAQVGRGFAALLRHEGGSVTLRLEPQSLGALTVRLDLDAGRVEATLEATTDQARRLLNESLGMLGQALEAHGLDVERLDVRLAERSQHAEWPAAGDGDRGGATEGGTGERSALSERQGVVVHDAPALKESVEPVWEPTEIGIGEGGALVRLRLDTVA